MHFLGEQQWIFIAIAFFGIIMSFGVNFFGRASEPGKARRSSGFLLLLNDALFYRSRVKKIELEIPGNRIARIYHDRSHKGVDLHQSLVKIDFLNDHNQKDTAAFKVPYPPQWMQAIENAFLKQK